MAAIKERQRLIALISGKGTTMKAIATATKDGRLPRTELVAVISSNPNAEGIQRARDLRIPEKDIIVINPKDYSSKLAYGEALLKVLNPREPDIIGQYGHTPLTPVNVIEEHARRMLNQHSGPIDPSKHDWGGKGMDNPFIVARVRLNFVNVTRRNFWTDVVAQRVSVKFDGGAVLKRGRVPILLGDTVRKLVERTLPVEWDTQIATLRDFEEGTVTELPRYTDLVLPSEQVYLKVFKHFARNVYPVIN